LRKNGDAYARFDHQLTDTELTGRLNSVHDLFSNGRNVMGVADLHQEVQKLVAAMATDRILLARHTFQTFGHRLQARTADGFEMQFGTNHLGHFLFTARLFPLLAQSVPSRIVNLSSHGHMIGGVDLDDPNYEHRPYDKWEAYGQAKTANVLFSRELDRRFGDHDVHAYAVHPGLVTTVSGQREMIADLERTRPSLLLRYSGCTWDEPNGSMRDGATLLDDYLSATYAPAQVVGSFQAWRRKIGRAPV